VNIAIVNNFGISDVDLWLGKSNVAQTLRCGPGRDVRWLSVSPVKHSSDVMDRGWNRFKNLHDFCLHRALVATLSVELLF